MKAVILAGGLGTRLSEETEIRPKPMVEVGGKPVLWHIMNIYSAYGVNEFIIAAGYKAEFIKEYFLNFYALNNDITVDLTKGETIIHNGNKLNWRIHVVDTGLNTQTGGRLKKLKKWLGKEEAFMFTYGDGVADIDVKTLMEFHRAHGKLATVTIVRAPARFGRIGLEGDQIRDFYEKPEAAEGWINGGFFILNPKVIDYIEDDETIWERSPIEKLALDGELMGYRHYGFWSCMDTLKEKNLLEELWRGGKAPWKVW
ncbi:MAG: glucose-1-phosphate cytidylyltransferase [Nitrospirae bacterium]|nr:glucose-1-phosphate cytidylyltransferase [Nitrospirota bacterium]